MFKPIKKPIYLALILALGGCGGGGGGGGDNTGSNSTPTPATTLSGKVVDGYVNGATIFCDANQNGVQDAGEASVTTSGQGDFTLASSCSATLVSTGGVDVTTGYPFQGVLKAPAGAAVVSPLTTLVSGSGLSNAQLVKALNLPDGTDLTKIDPALPDNTAILKKTLAVQQIVQQLATLMGTANSPSAFTRLYTMVADSLASTLAASPSAALVDATGSVNTTLIAAALQTTVTNVSKDSSLQPVSLTAADIAGVAAQVGQQAQQFATADDASLAKLTTQLQNPQLLPPQTAAMLSYYISPKNDSVILNNTPYTLAQFGNPGVTLTGLNSVGFEYAATAGTQVDVLANVGISVEEIGGQGRVLQFEIDQVHIERSDATGIMKLSLTPQTIVYVHAKDSRNNELNVTVPQPSFNPIATANNALVMDYATLVNKVVGNTTYNTTSLTPSQFFNLKGSFKTKFVVSNNLNVRYQDGTPLQPLTVNVTNTSHSVSGPGAQGILNIQ
jgi:hypothetical protein